MIGFTARQKLGYFSYPDGHWQEVQGSLPHGEPALFMENVTTRDQIQIYSGGSWPEGLRAIIFGGASDFNQGIREQSVTDGRSRALFFRTSGTTQESRFVSISFEAVEKKSMGKQSTEPLIWGHFYDNSRIASHNVVAHALSAGDKVAERWGTASTVSQLAFYKLVNVNAISLTPSLAKQLIGLEQFNELDLKQITLGGEITDQTLINRLKVAFPQSRISHVYATTETGSLFSVSDGIAGFPASMLGRPIGNGRYAIHIDHGFLVIKDIASGETWESGDSVDLETESGRVVFTGRQQQVVKVGGRKVYLEKVKSAICRNPGVIDAVVYSVSNPFLGNTVEADVWLNSENAEDRLRLLSSLGEQLEKWEKPVRVNWVKNIELSLNGKMGLRNA